MELPIIYNKFSNKFCANPLRKTCPLKMYNWFFMAVEGHFFFLFGFMRVVWLISTFKQSIWSNLRVFEEVAVYTIFVTIMILAILTVWTVELQIFDICWVATQALNLLETYTKIDWPNRHRIPSLKESLVYLMTIGFATFIPFAAAFPIIRNYDPFQLMVSNFPQRVIPKPISKCIASFIYGAMCSYATWPVLLVALKCLITADTVVQSIRQAYGKVIKQRFYSCLHLYRKLTIIITIGNEILYYYIPIAISVIISVATFCVCLIVMMYDVLPMVFYVCLVALTLMAIYLICTIVGIASIPSDEAKKFKNYWRRMKLNRKGRKELETCWPIAYRIGPFGRMVRTTPCDIFMVILNYSVTLILALTV
ncbi:unnamed protein product [Orchesella dallaii]|uniref:Odorant receptor n=1 Tax=Orchesella dallaii TaxID=48710 RepID=A0ABP1RJ35_9HEXA